MFTRGEVERLILAHQHVREAIEQSVPRRAASILCKEFKWLLDGKSSFWAGVKDSAEELAKYREKESQVFGNLTALVEDEVSIFARLKIKPQRTREVISDAFNSLISMQNTKDGPSPDNLKVLKGRLELATKLVCKESKGPFRRGVDWVLSWKGATVLGGAALVGANILVFTQAPNHGPVCWKSVKAGLKVMRGELDGLIELLG